LIRMGRSEQEITGDRLLALLEALANPHRLLIVSILSRERKYVSQLARELEMSRPLLYMHLKKMEKAGIVKSSLELSDDGKAMKYYELVPFDLPLNQELIAKAAQSLTTKPKGSES
jgi:DNA-binding transcriptional ArsR family regulator